MNETRLVKTHVARNQHRFYRLFIRQGLFGGFALTREWGRIGHPGTVRDDWFPTFEAAALRLEERTEDKLRRGYSEGPAP